MTDGSCLCFPKGIARLTLIAFPIILSLCLLAFIFALSAASARAGSICVKPDGGDGCEATITEALAQAQEGDTIMVAAGTYTENVLITQTITLQGGWALDFSVRDLSQYTSTIVPEDETFSVVYINGEVGNTSLVAPTVDGFEITGGRADLGGNNGGGMSVLSSDAVILSNTIHNNSAYLGGGIFNNGGTLTLDSSTVSNNSATQGGGILSLNGALTLTNSIVSDNTATTGGGISASGTSGSLVIFNSSVSNNTSLNGPGGISINLGAVTLTNSVVSGNSASSGEGCCGGLSNTGAMTITSSVVSGNSTNGEGGGIWNSGTLTLSSSSVSDNLGGDLGGGIFGEFGGTVVLTESTISGNSALQGVGVGGGIANGGALTITHSTVNSNISKNGGGIWNSANSTLINSTVSGNTAAGTPSLGGDGGGIQNLGTLTLTNSTVSSNLAESGSISDGRGGGIHNSSVTGGTVEMVNTILAGNTADSGPDCTGAAISSQGYNLVGDDTGCDFSPMGGDLVGVDPMLDPLQDNGGPTQTHALKPGSPAIDAGDNGICPPTDQRGVHRPIDGDGEGQATCDIGAYEYQLTTITTILADDPDPYRANEPFTVTSSVTSTQGLPTGVVIVSVSDSLQQCSAMLVSGVGSCVLTLSESGPYTLTATYGGDGTYAPSSTTENHTVEKSGTKMYLPVIQR